MEAYFRFRMWDLAGRGPVPPRLLELIALLEEHAAQMEKAVGSPAVFCPNSLLRCVRMLQSYLAGERFPKYPGSVVFAQQIEYPPIDWRICANDRQSE